MIAFAEAIDADALRIRHEFMEMPGLTLTVAQTARLYALSTAHAETVLDGLEDDGFLLSAGDGVYRRSMPPTSD